MIVSKLNTIGNLKKAIKSTIKFIKYNEYTRNATDNAQNHSYNFNYGKLSKKCVLTPAVKDKAWLKISLRQCEDKQMCVQAQKDRQTDRHTYIHTHRTVT